VGTAHCLALKTEVPFLLRILAVTFHKMKPGTQLIFDPTTVHIIDRDAPRDSPLWEPTSFYKPWWTIPHAADGYALGSDDLAEGLRHHEELLGDKQLLLPLEKLPTYGPGGQSRYHLASRLLS